MARVDDQSNFLQELSVLLGTSARRLVADRDFPGREALLFPPLEITSASVTEPSGNPIDGE